MKDGCLFAFGTYVEIDRSSTFVLAMYSEYGDLNPSNKRKLIWGLIQLVVATALLLAGGLKPLQTASIVAAFPFIFIMFAAIYSTFKAFASEFNEDGSKKEEERAVS